MARSSYGYQYDTNPRKIEPEYRQRKTKTKSNKTKKVSRVTTSKERKKKDSKKKEQERLQKRKVVKAKIGIGFKSCIIFVIAFAMLFRSSQLSEKFSKIQELKASITELQKENNQLEINIQNSLNLNTIEQAAKELLGMQKLTNKQTVYVSLSKKDYVEPRVEEIIMNDKTTIFDKIVDYVKGLF